MIGFGKNDTLSTKECPFLISLADSEEEQLEITVALPVQGEKGSLSEDPNEGVQKLLEECTPILPDYNSMYKITFEQYVIYQTRNESFYAMDKSEAWEGKFFRIFSRSVLLDSLPQITLSQLWAEGEAPYPDTWIHYQICCERHIIDVISLAEPKVERVGK